MRQVPLRLVPALAPTFDNFVAGPNADMVAQLRALVGAPSPVFLWGESGSGKSHLLGALAREVEGAVAARGGRVLRWGAGAPQASAAGEFDPAVALIVLDDVHQLDARQQHQAFSWLVQAQAHGVPWAAASTMPPVDLPLRDDLRSRLAWGPVFAVQALPEAQTREVLRREASRRGIGLGEDLLDHLLHRHARDLGFLMRLFDQLDAYALSQSRPVTVALLRRMLGPAHPEPSATTPWPRPVPE